MNHYVTVYAADARVSMPARYISGPGFVWSPWGWLSSLPAATLIQAPGAFLVRA